MINIFCWHKWEVIERFELFIDNEDNKAIGVAFILQCNKCGNIKKNSDNME